MDAKRVEWLESDQLKELQREQPDLREVAGWCMAVWDAKFDPKRVRIEIVECDDGPYLLCESCAKEVRAQMAFLKEKGRLPGA